MGYHIHENNWICNISTSQLLLLPLEALLLRDFQYERTVRRDQDPTGYAVTAKAPAILAEGEAGSQFRNVRSEAPAPK